MTCYRRYPKWTMVAHHESYLLFGMHLRYGPCQDSPSFVPAVTQAARHLPIDRLFADGAYDVEAHHRYSREQLGIRSTIIPINPRRPHQHEPKTKYRAQLHRRFPRRLYGSRWHVEAAISQHKRKIGSALSATSEPGRESECILRHIVHNLMILLLSTRKGFYRAFYEQCPPATIGLRGDVQSVETSPLTVTPSTDVSVVPPASHGSKNSGTRPASCPAPHGS